jgi:4-hydroxy-tetrahydrodipicolinate synthase
VDEANGKVPVIAGTGASSTLAAIKFTKNAEDVGADAVLVVAPYYLRADDKGDFQHFYELANSTNLPIILYNIPQCTGGFLRREVVEDLAELENIVGIKDSSGNMAYIMELLETVGDRISILVGYDEIVLPALASGVKGMILASANVIPDKWLELYESVAKGDLDKARRIQMSVQKLVRIFCRYGAHVAVKEALKMMNFDVGESRLPLVRGGFLSLEIREEIKLELEKLEVLQPKFPIKEIPLKSLQERFQDLKIDAEIIAREKLKVGEGNGGEGITFVHVDLIAGPKDGPIGEAWLQGLLNATPGHEAVSAILEPNLMVKPITLVMPAVDVKSMRQASILFGPIQIAIGKAVIDAVEKNIIPIELVETYAIITKVYVNPEASDRKTLYINAYNAASKAIKKAFGWK